MKLAFTSEPTGTKKATVAPKIVKKPSTPKATFVANRVAGPSNVAVKKPTPLTTPSKAVPKPAAKPAPTPAKPDPVVPAQQSIEDWLAGDTTYQDQQAQLRKAYAEFVSNQNLDKNNYETNYAQQLRNLQTSKDKGFADLENDYASRGLLQSGVYGQAYSDLQNQFDTQQSDMETARAQYESNLAAALAGFQGDQDTTLTAAKQEAIARRAAKLNLGA